MNYNHSIRIKSTLRTSDEFEGQSLEEKIRAQVESNAPIEAISPMLYTERKDGVRPETNIRTDRFEIAREAMGTITEGLRKRRQERLKAVSDKPQEPVVK